MRRTILVVGVALLMATFVTASAAPVTAAPPSIQWVCETADGSFVFAGASNEVPRRAGDLLDLCREQGGAHLTQTVNGFYPGKPDGIPPCCVPEGAKP
jgi:hypothetical protein